MTENKRFTLREPKIDKYIGCSEIANCGKWITYGKIVDLLNDRERLKQENEFWKSNACSQSNLNNIIQYRKDNTDLTETVSFADRLIRNHCDKEGIEMWDKFNGLMWEAYKKRVGWKE